MWDDEDEWTPQPRPPPAPTPPPPPPAPLLQPDEVRLRSAHGDDFEMRCGERIPPESIVTTKDGANAVTVFVRATYKGPTDDPSGFHAWRYTVEFTAFDTGRWTAGMIRRLTLRVQVDNTRPALIDGTRASAEAPTLTLR